MARSRREHWQRSLDSLFKRKRDREELNSEIEDYSKELREEMNQKRERFKKETKDGRKSLNEGIKETRRRIYGSREERP